MAQVRKPGIVRNTLVQGKRPLISPIIQGIDPKNIVELHPTIVFEVDPSEETEERTFILIAPGVTIDSNNEIKYQGTFMYPQGNVVFLFEEIMPGKE